MRIALAQINPTVGDLAGNSTKIISFAEKARAAAADLVVFPELALTGYPPEDLLLKPAFIRDNLAALSRLAASLGDTRAVVGFVDKAGDDIFNAAAFIEGGAVRKVYHKILLPNYGVFDEKRYFAPGREPLVVRVEGVNAGIIICEDIWFEARPLTMACAAGAKLIVVINGSPYHEGKVREREELIQKHAKDNKVPIAYVNLVGGQDELVFDGYSMVVSPSGEVTARAEGFTEDLLLVDIPSRTPSAPKPPLPARSARVPGNEEEVYAALTLGLRDYLHKNGFREALVGLSGGIDSALVATLAADALGPEHVHAIYMPSAYSSDISGQDAEQLARNLGIDYRVIPISDLFDVYLKVLGPHFKGKAPGITEENLQARIRGNLLMAFSNKFGWIVLTTGNKSEMSAGYATLYGDMAGGFAVIKDVPKVLVYRLSLYRNSRETREARVARSPVIPQRIIEREPTAELRPGQKDSDSIPVYETLDPILKAYVEENRSFAEISSSCDPAIVSQVISLVDKSEYKRRQSPPGIKITPRAFGRDRRMPITNRYRENGRK